MIYLILISIVYYICILYIIQLNIPEQVLSVQQNNTKIFKNNTKTFKNNTRLTFRMSNDYINITN